jgi:cell division protein FtsB
LGVVAVVLAFALFGDRGFLYLFKLKRQQSELQQQLTQVEAVNAGLRREIASLSSDRQYLERLARSQLGMVREDEIVYQFSNKGTSGSPASAATVTGAPH